MGNNSKVCANKRQRVCDLEKGGRKPVPVKVASTQRFKDQIVCSHHFPCTVFDNQFAEPCASFPVDIAEIIALLIFSHVVEFSSDSGQINSNLSDPGFSKDLRALQCHVMDLWVDNVMKRHGFNFGSCCKQFQRAEKIRS